MDLLRTVPERTYRIHRILGLRGQYHSALPMQADGRDLWKLRRLRKLRQHGREKREKNNLTTTVEITLTYCL